MKKNLIKTILREALALIACMSFAIIMEQFFWGSLFTYNSIIFALRVVAPVLYLSFLFIRFTIRAVRVMREK